MTVAEFEEFIASDRANIRYDNPTGRVAGYPLPTHAVVKQALNPQKRYSFKTTTENLINKHIDQNPDDIAARSGLADYLAESGDARADGYLTMVRLGIHSLKVANFYRVHCRYKAYPMYPDPRYIFPQDWFVRFSSIGPSGWFEMKIRSRLEDRIALAWRLVPAADQARILDHSVV